MGFSESTQHWLEDGELITGPRITSSTTIPSYDPTEPVAGRRRTIFVVGGAAVVALIVAGALYLQSGHHATEEAAPAVARTDPAGQLTRRAEAALAANRPGEALDLAAPGAGRRRALRRRPLRGRELPARAQPECGSAR
jgi:hypothetical protein